MLDEVIAPPIKLLAEVFAESTNLQAADTSTSSSSSEADATDDDMD